MSKTTTAKDILTDKIQKMQAKADRYKKLLKGIKWKTLSKEEEKSFRHIFSDIKP